MTTLLTILSRFPLKTLVVITFLSFIDLRYPPLSLQFGYAEFYPLSSVPMYSTFAPTANYVYITDADDNPLPAYPTFKTLSSALKKSFKDQLRTVKDEINVSTSKMTPEQKRPAGDALLRELKTSISPTAFEDGALPHIRLYEVILSIDDDTGIIVKDTHLVGELHDQDHDHDHGQDQSK